MPRKEATTTGSISAQAQQSQMSDGIENYELPKTLVTKIAKSAIPQGNVMFQKDTISSLVKGSTVFINYLAATAHEVALSKQHKSISATDVLKALEIIEFRDLAQSLQGELQIYRDLNKGSSSTATASASAHSKKPSINIPPKSRASAKSKAAAAASVSAGPQSVSAPKPMQGDQMDVDEPEDGNEEIDDDAEEVQELQDAVAMEDEELTRDAKGVEERSRHAGDAMDT